MKDLLSYSHLSFDLDGTILDTLEIMSVAWDIAAREFNLTCDFLEYKKEIGLPFEVIMENMGIIDDDEIIQKFYFEQTDKLSHKVKVFPFISEFIEKARYSGMSTSIITSKPRKNSENLLSKFNINVDILLCGDDACGAKPSSLPMDYVRTKLGLSKSKKIIYFGDMLNDLVFAINSGVDYCHCNFGVIGELSDLIVPQTPSIDSWDSPDINKFLSLINKKGQDNFIDIIS